MTTSELERLVQTEQERSITTHLSAIRTVVGLEHLPRSKGGTYRLEASTDERDVSQFVALVQQGLASADLAAARDLIEQALRIWPISSPLPECRPQSSVAMEFKRLERRRRQALERLMGLQLDLGEYQAVISTCTELVYREPESELLWEYLARATERMHGPSAARTVIQDVRDVLGQEYGVELSARLGEYERSLLRGEREDGTRRGGDDPRSKPPRHKVSITQLSVTGPNLFGRDVHLQRLTDVWQDQSRNVIVIAAWAGVGKSALVNRWINDLERTGGLGSDGPVYAWSFYKQGTLEPVVSGDLFIESALRFFDDPAPTTGDAWQRGERLAHLVRQHRTLLVLEGLEPLQYPPGPEDGRLKDQALVALLRELGHSNAGLVIVSTRLAVRDLSYLEGDRVETMWLPYLEPEDGAALLRSLGVRGSENELRQASVDFNGHAMALMLLGSYLEAAYAGDVTRRTEIRSLQADIRYGGHARRILAAYSEWFGASIELEALRMIGLLDRPVPESVLFAVRQGPALDGLTNASSTASEGRWRQALAALRRARLLAPEDPARPEYIDVHPLVREHFREELAERFPTSWATANARLFEYFCGAAPLLPATLDVMEPLFQAIACGCRAGRHAEALKSVYTARIMRGSDYFAATELGALGSLVAVLSYFFEGEGWTRPSSILSPVDQLFILLEAGGYLSALRGYASAEVGDCYRAALPLSREHGTLEQIVQATLGLCRYHRLRGELTAALNVVAALMSEDATLPVTSLSEASTARELASTLFYVGDFVGVARHTKRALIEVSMEEARLMARLAVNDPTASCLGYLGLSLWFLGQPDDAREYAARATRRAKEVGHAHSLAVALWIQTMIAHFREDLADVRRHAGDLVALSARHRFTQWEIAGHMLGCWVDGVDGTSSTVTALSKMARLREAWLATGARLFVPYWWGVAADLSSDRSGAAERAYAANMGLTVSQAHRETWWDAELHRLAGEAVALLGDANAADRHLRSAHAIAAKQASPILAVRVAGSLAKIQASIRG